VRGANYDADQCMVAANVRERLPVTKETTHRFRMARISLKKLNKLFLLLFKEKVLLKG
jgi:hypothetical protein